MVKQRKTLVMPYQIKILNKNIKDTFYSLTPVHWILRMFILRNVKRRENKLVQCWSLTETLIVVSVMLTINIFSFVTKMQIFDINIKKDYFFLDTIQLTYILSFAGYIVDLVFVYKMRHSFVKYLEFYANIDKIINAPNFSKIKMKNVITVVLFIISFLVSTFLDYLAWFIGFGWVEPTLYCLDYIYFFIISLTVLDFISNVIQIEHRLKMMAQVTKELTSSLITIYRNVDENRIENQQTISHDVRVNFDIPSLSKFYVLLMDQVNYVNTAYGVRVSI